LAINYRIISITIAIIIGISIILTQYTSPNFSQENNLEYSGEFFNFNIETENTDLIELDIDSIFKISGVRDEYIIDGTFQKYLLPSSEYVGKGRRFQIKIYDH